MSTRPLHHRCAVRHCHRDGLVGHKYCEKHLKPQGFVHLDRKIRKSHHRPLMSDEEYDSGEERHGETRERLERDRSRKHLLRNWERRDLDFISESETSMECRERRIRHTYQEGSDEDYADCSDGIEMQPRRNLDHFKHLWAESEKPKTHRAQQRANEDQAMRQQRLINEAVVARHHCTFGPDEQDWAPVQACKTERGPMSAYGSSYDYEPLSSERSLVRGRSPPRMPRPRTTIHSGSGNTS